MTKKQLSQNEVIEKGNKIVTSNEGNGNEGKSGGPGSVKYLTKEKLLDRITSYNVCYTKLLRFS